MLTWKELIAQEKQEPYFKSLTDFILQDAKQHTIYPPHKDVFNAFKHTPINKVRALILGQDPYIGEGQAHGLAFSVPTGIPCPPSLRNIFKELDADLGLEPSFSAPTDLTYWAKQGVLLLNSALTVRAGESGSHSKIGWHDFTDRAIKLVSEQQDACVFLLWGSHAKSKAPLIDQSKHLVLQAAHPSPLSAHNGFFGCKHFSRTNGWLAERGMEPIDWSLG